MVSKPVRGKESTGLSSSGPGPASTRQVATSVAPFQLTYISTLSPSPDSATSAGVVCGSPFQGKRKALYDSTSGGELASKSSSPSRENSEKYGSLPHPTKPWPPGRPCTFPWVSDSFFSGRTSSPASVALMASSSTSTTIPREGSSLVTLPLSKIVIKLFPWRRTSCCQYVRVPGPISKSLFLPPRRHATSPVLRSTL